MTTSIEQKAGWALKLDDKYWGESDAGYGFTNKINKIYLHESKEKPTGKIEHFTESTESLLQQIEAAEWVYVSLEIATRLTEPYAEIDKMKRARDLLSDLMAHSPMTGTHRVSELDENLTGMIELFTFLDRIGKSRDILVLNAFVALEKVINDIENCKWYVIR